jgi:hypothetical protein
METKNSPAFIIAVPSDECGVGAPREPIILSIKKWKQNNENDEDEDEHDGNA